jgi:hypothetical protein
MGYDIEIWELAEVDDHTSTDILLAYAYMSFNWFDLGDICVEHFLHKDGKCPVECNRGKYHLWSIREDCHARYGYDITIRAKHALDFLRYYNVNPGIPDENNNNWCFGCVVHHDWTSSNLPPMERLSVFAYHVSRFVELGNKYSTCLFIGDHGQEPEIELSEGERLSVEIYFDMLPVCSITSDDINNHQKILINSKNPPGKRSAESLPLLVT